MVMRGEGKNNMTTLKDMLRDMLYEYNNEAIKLNNEINEIEFIAPDEDYIDELLDEHIQIIKDRLIGE